ncbi:angiopoietin-related protein 5-like [Salarias fasciatus]|uniref:angiopoietin-related protein 5-like n=1 Tax=Salarias fasciatus TaxID=181472 RepID=UPI0011765638|nr:angiopoietin-related protein 5-like [Salarias fasciatus]
MGVEDSGVRGSPPASSGRCRYKTRRLARKVTPRLRRHWKACNNQTDLSSHGPGPRGSDCTEIKRLLPESRSGVYMIHPAASRIPFKVYCEMRPDGGWTVIQKRTGPAVSFDQNWASYDHGFGHLTWDHWLGLRKIYWLTQSKRMSLRVDLWDYGRETAYAEYEDFSLGSPSTAYKLNIGRYSGTAGDAIHGAKSEKSQNGFGFSTSDRDNDGCDNCNPFGHIPFDICTQFFGGGWWLSDCGSANLNGFYHPIFGGTRLQWRTWIPPIAATRMMIKSE